MPSSEPKKVLPPPTSAAASKNGGFPPFSTERTVEVIERIRDLTVKRKPIDFLNEFEEYWSKHTPDALDLADEFGISDRQVRDLWKREVLTRGAALEVQMTEWDEYQAALHGNARKHSASYKRDRP